MIGRHRRSDREPVSGPHEFVEPSDPRLGLALGGAQSLMAPSAMTSLVAATSLGRDACAAAGCGRPRKDPIHWVPDGRG
jgi:hypothetical protein